MRHLWCCAFLAVLATVVLFFFLSINSLLIMMTVATQCQNIKDVNILQQAGCATGWNGPKPGIIGCSALYRYIEEPELFEAVPYADDVYDELADFYNRTCTDSPSITEEIEAVAFVGAALFVAPALLHAKYTCGYDDQYDREMRITNVEWCTGGWTWRI